MCKHHIPANTIHSPIVGSMLAHRLRRWPNIDPTMGESIMFPGIPIVLATYRTRGYYSRQRALFRLPHIRYCYNLKLAIKIICEFQ